MSTPQFCIVLYVKKDLISLRRFLSESHSFFAKFQIPFQVTVVSNNRSAQFQKELESICNLSKQSPSVQSILYKKAKGRAECLSQRLSLEKKEELVLLADLSLSTPFADLLRLLQELIQNPEASAVWGDRFHHKSKSMQNKKSARLSLERLFTPIVKEKDHNMETPDPLCEIGALRPAKLNWSLMKTKRRNSSWYLHRHLSNSLKTETIMNKYLMLPIADSGETSADYSLVKEIWNLSFF